MLGTLIKHEFIYIIKTFSMIYIIFLLIALVLKILSSTIISLSPEKIDSAFDASSTDPMMSTVYIAFITITFIFGALSAAMPFFAIIDNIRRFQKNMFTDEGYLTNTLPVTATEHVAAKLLAGLANYIVCGIVLIVGMLITGGTDTIEVLNEIIGGITDPNIPIHEKLGVVLILITGFIMFILYGYLITAFNSMTNSKGCVTAIIVFFSITLGITFFSRLMAAIILATNSEDFGMFIVAGVFALVSALFWFLLTNILNKHLNLQ